jgi:heme/copper-type cytochrome/quinol oxidase subunit 2
VAWWTWLVVVVAVLVAVVLLTLAVQARRRSGTVVAVWPGHRPGGKGVR